ncbi:hypothetical protein Nepgr_008001 [Nepenthes gracilis]|uniref:Uncharacterized protein n=1 Tax=Nepenthes gracilis TaxID=150966 RepID=A0AAD3S8A4_NEPGR|nr:hypothetical protein Nepgr_008001 [Nepenthes gracilis]
MESTPSNYPRCGREPSKTHTPNKTDPKLCLRQNQATSVFHQQLSKRQMHHIPSLTPAKYSSTSNQFFHPQQATSIASATISPIPCIWLQQHPFGISSLSFALSLHLRIP